MTACIFCGEPIPPGRVVRGSKLPVPTKFCTLKCNAKADTARLKFRRDMSWKLAKALKEMLRVATVKPCRAGDYNDNVAKIDQAKDLLGVYDRGPVFPAQKEGE